MMVFRLQCKSGRHTLSTITPSSTLRELQAAIAEKTNISPDKQKILHSYPPKEISTYDVTVTIGEIGIRPGDTITLQELTESRNKHSTNVKSVSTSSSSVDCQENDVIITKEERPLQINETLNRKVVPADNSCLFKSISILIDSNVSVNELRQLVASVITSQPTKYTPAVLGSPTDTYVQWILKDESWGGGIELSVFSELYQIEFDVVDIQTVRIDKFGEGFTNKGFLIYDGIHYDPLVLLSPSNGSIIQRLFKHNDHHITTQALQIAKEAQKNRQFTDLSNFSLRCLVCGTLLKGQSDAQTHAKTTGHINFGEVN